MRDWLLANRKAAEPEALRIRLRSFLAHFWVDRIPVEQASEKTVESSKAIETGKSFDWLRAFQEFPLEVLDAACVEYLKASAKKPTIADLRAICIRLDKDMALLPRLTAIADQIPTERQPETQRMSREETLRLSAWLKIARERNLTPVEMRAWQRGEAPPDAGRHAEGGMNV